MPYILKAEHLENKDNKVKSISENANDEQYPSAKAVLDAIEQAKTELNAVLAPTIDESLLEDSTNAVQNKVVTSAINGKVDKEEGKGLSESNYTAAEKTKLQSIAYGATTVYVDSVPTEGSSNAVQSGAVALQIKDVRTIAQGAVNLINNEITPDIGSLESRVGNNEVALNGIQDTIRDIDTLSSTNKSQIESLDDAMERVSLSIDSTILPRITALENQKVTDAHINSLIDAKIQSIPSASSEEGGF